MLPNAKLLSCAQKYRKLRMLTRDLLEEEAFGAYRLKITVDCVEDRALAAIRDQWPMARRRVPFPWDKLTSTLQKSHPRRLDLSFWCDGLLCGVGIARLSDAKEWLSYTHIEGAPDDHPLKKRVVPLLLVGAQVYATLVQTEDQSHRFPKVRILNPLKDSMDWYATCGYSEMHQQNGYNYAVRK